MSEIRVCHIAYLISDNRSVKLRCNPNLFTVCTETYIIQNNDRGIYHPTIFCLLYIITGSMRKTAKAFHFVTYLIFCDDSFCYCFLIYYRISHTGNILYFFYFFKRIHCRIFHSNHHIPHILITFKICLPCTDPRQCKKTLHDCKCHKRKY